MFEVRQRRYAKNTTEGIVFFCLNRYVWIYEDGLRVLFLGADSGFNAKGQHIAEVQFPKNLRWQRPHNDELIDNEQKEAIKSHIREALASLEPNSLVEFSDE